MSNKRLRYSDHSKSVNTTPLKLDVIMIQQRPDDHPWVLEAKQTVAEQCYPHLGLITIDNIDHQLTIGQAWNLGVQESDADLVLMFGDDDGLCVDCATVLVEGFTHLRKKAPNLVHLSSHCTVLNEEDGVSAQVAIAHTGMFLRQYLLDQPFDEDLQRHVGAAKVRAIEHSQRFLGEPLSMAVLHYSGYIYRQHMFMASGNPIRFNK